MARMIYVAPALAEQGSAIASTLGNPGGHLEAIGQKSTVA